MIGSCVIRDNKIIYANDYLCKFLGSRSITGQSIFDYCEPLDSFNQDSINQGKCLLRFQNQILVEAIYEIFPGHEGTVIINFARGDSEETYASYEFLAEIRGFAALERDFTGVINRLREIENEYGKEGLWEYFYENEDQIKDLHEKIKILRLNPTMIEILECDSMEEAIKHLSSNMMMNHHLFLKEIQNVYEEFDLDKRRKINIRTAKDHTRMIMRQTRLYNSKNHRLTSLYYDITSFEDAQMLLRESELRFDRFFEDMPLAISIMKDSKLYRCNAKFLEEHGFATEEEILGKHTDFFIDSSYRPELVKFRSERLKRDNFTNIYRIRLKRKSGSTYPAIMHAQRVEFDGELYSIGIEVNISEQEKQAEIQRQLMESHRLESLALLSGGIAHDFNNILMVIEAGLELLDLTEEFTPDNKTLVADMRSTTKQATSLVKQLLTYSGKSVISENVIELNEMIRNSISMYRLAIPKNIEIVYELSEKELVTEISPTDLNQVMMNFIINASDAIGDNNGEISIKSREFSITKTIDPREVPDCIKEKPNEMYACIEISDTGCGISSDKLSRIFDPFYTTKSSGRGLGLSVVHGIITQANGCIDVRSEIGRGTEFYLYLPITGKKPNYSDDNTERKFKILSGTILVVDDEKKVRSVLVKMIRQLGFVGIEVENGKACIESLENNDVDLVILDLEMPVMSGQETFKMLRNNYPSIPIIINSGNLSREFLSDYKMERVRILQKPYNINNLYNAVLDLLDE